MANSSTIPSSARVDPTARASGIEWVAVGIVAIVAATCLVYWPAMRGGFIWDDEVLLTNTNLIRDPHGLYRIWFTTDPADYWPVTNTSFWIEWRLWGTHPLGYHLTNLVLHIGASLLVWAILRKLAIPGAFLAALLFAVHPVNVEAVAWIAQRKTVLALVFFLLSIFCYLKDEQARPQSAGRWYWLSLVAFTLAVLSKGSVAILPLVLLLITWWGKNRITARDLARIAPFVLVAVPLVRINMWFQTHGGEPIRTADFIERLLGANAAIWFYLSKALLPVNLVFVYPQWHIDTGSLLWWLPLVATLGVSAALWHWRATPWVRATWFAWVYFCIALLPVLGFVDVYFMKYSLVADHYQNAALIGVMALVAAGWSQWFRHAGQQMPATVVAGLVVGALVVLGMLQSATYRDAETLYRATLATNTTCWMVYNNLGLVLAQKGSLPEATEQFEQSLRLRPDSAEAHSNLGNALAQAGKPEEAIEQFQRAITCDANFLPARYNLATLLVGLGRTPAAIEHLEQTVRLKPDFPAAHNLLAQALFSVGRAQEAIEHFDAWLKASPEDLTAWSNLATANLLANRPAAAIAAGERARALARAQGKAELAQQLGEWLTSIRSGGAAQQELPTQELPATSLPPTP